MQDENAILKLYETLKHDIYKPTPEYISLLRKIEEQENLFSATLSNEQGNWISTALSEEQEEIMNTIEMYNTKKQELINKQIFTYAFSLANKLFIESIKNMNK